MIKGEKQISSESRCEFGGGKYSSQQKSNSAKCQQEDHARSICVCKYDKFCEISEQLKNCTYTKLLVDGILVICNKIADMPETASINPNSWKTVHTQKVLLMVQQLYVIRLQICQRLHQSVLMTKQIIGILLLLYQQQCVYYC